LIDEVHAFIAPKLIGGAGAPSPIGGAGAADMSHVWPLSHWTHEAVGADVYLHGWTSPPASE
jgi:diaminohydroxyphosphoribosylaminopyrimidine deaminase/5-amino-6-(5-phosphoribosylamino)uracil reductase